MPKLQLFAREPKKITVSDGVTDNSVVASLAPETGAVKNCIYAPNGSLFAYAVADGVHVVDPETCQETLRLDEPNVLEIGFSPLGSFIITWEIPKKDPASGNFKPNLKVFNSKTGDHVQSFVQKSQTGWNLQYTFDEKYCARMVKDEIQFFESDVLTKVWAKLRVENCADFSVSPGKNYSVAVFVPEKKGLPAKVQIYHVPNFNQAVAQKTFFKAEEVGLKWNALGTSLLVLAQTASDATGRSYYGETTLYLLGITGAFDSRITLDKEGPIHDVAWSPNSREFAVVYGYMPSKTTFFDARGNEIHTLAECSRNTIRFSPHGRLVLLGGFGNIQGAVDILDRQSKFAKVATLHAANASHVAWSPDSQYVLTATTAPRLRVDNGFRIWHVKGNLMYAQDFPELFAADWRPLPSSEFPSGHTISECPEAHESAKTAKEGAKAPVAAKPAGAYRPPHARGQPERAARGSLAASPDPSSGPKVRGAGGRVIPGAAPKKHEEKNGAVPVATVDDKKIRALLKKLRAIEDLKAKQTNGEKLEDTQIQKISTEGNVRDELKKYGWDGVSK
ncbi:eukaryotic translation initiation factor eIF2A-domain-containing protein [Yarrowia lipolytica]|jgi:translation initiation factor 2A|uniref:Eukaryotic translation initiation factor 2A n=2 Tax=Yarrowia lipolytica TaxID=4952 RepID=Q6CCJ4_YARLI|nr:YALI0C08877p [Yarrowia lipolytica CLIB122]AOW02549.1 hypothetical protein YALI1_C12140g [Yarrowia lipolytica]KAB8280131.1 eukaryotic translation initiation factor eIF2A-domain-containing protein [Yarrowia lipolytica]KAE8169066.1 eukaryotic translation initiation factor eIF2A-domain-containing protein [Yarrowia lipolytica]KAJ8053234.1 eukaryotic translation initiation factor eIF2A-domain-containing protein [Yarrowia lipolytica]QNP96510.1 Eukaryotic translation initiation factor 2A [Yarrowia |eukprot:XP_501618.1 YALI0C08877p [Yarrowia lipolytica CLIB122]